MTATVFREWDTGYVMKNGTVVLSQDEDMRRSIRPAAIDSITIDIGGGVATLHLRTGENVAVVYDVTDNPKWTVDPYEDFNEFCLAVEALIDDPEREP